MAGGLESRTTVPAFPGLDHLSGQITHWDAAVRTLSFTATALAESVTAGGSAPQASTCPWKPVESAPGGAEPSRVPAPALGHAGPQALQPPAASTLLIPATQLKPGRVFVVANLQGAYYTLLELLSRHKFDFRSDNLLHLGNLVAPPAPLGPQPPLPVAEAAPAAAFATPASGFGGGLAPMVQPPQSPSRRLRNSAAVLKLFRRHGGLGPMGGNECLTVLAVARSNRVQAEHRAEEERRLAGLLEQQQQLAGRDRAAGRGRCSALSMQLAAAATGQGPAASAAAGTCASAAPAAPPAPMLMCVRRTPAAWLAASDSSEGSSDDSEDEDCETGRGMDVEMVAAPMTPLRDETSAAALPSPSPLGTGSAAAPGPAATDVRKTESSRGPPPAALSFRGSGGGGGGACSGANLDDPEVVQLLSMPACVVLEPYGVQLVHAAGTSGRELPRLLPGAGALPADTQPGPYHTLFSHRRPGPSLLTSPSPPGGGCGTAATATGLSSSRNVVRFAVLPPLRTLQRKSPGFPGKVAAAVVPSREDLLLEVFEEPLSELDA